MKKLVAILSSLIIFSGFAQESNVSLIVLGTLQDGGSPHIGCSKSCCTLLFENPDPTRKVVSLGILDSTNQKTYLFEATPDFSAQLQQLQQHLEGNLNTPNGIFLTHAHIGHYTGLMYLGREALGAKNVPVYAMPKMKHFLENNGPWSQLVSLNNMNLHPLAANTKIQLTNALTVEPFLVPHRDEFSETIGYKVYGPNKTVLFIPDIDKWAKWESSIVEEIKKVDYAFIDATFYSGEEINNRAISEIPHPFVIESMELFKELSKVEKSKIYFTHFNHTNPLLNKQSKAYQEVLMEGYKLATYGLRIKL
ncbi:hypothetical protein GCM10011414_21400 [Croceivirga lutea]|uniref:MBL fold metallo-hydrolase n=1 Tax=Croceivirga lutea TaxID=1775167 RepID=UPI0016395540|nr:MBL fold metallo-hydrolase [Croceivirga lutea]GGG51542.1 hypothetical protein GCM10011414_21400 [Croceivirga lutea]